MISVIVNKSEVFGWTTYFIYEDEEMSHFSFDTKEAAIKKAKELMELL